jgi:hypothetical protein
MPLGGQGVWLGVRPQLGLPLWESIEPPGDLFPGLAPQKRVSGATGYNIGWRGPV